MVMSILYKLLARSCLAGIGANSYDASTYRALIQFPDQLSPKLSALSNVRSLRWLDFVISHTSYKVTSVFRG